MKAKVLVDNIRNDIAEGEWGLCILVEHEGKKILLDTGASSLFAQNAEKMGVDVAQIDFAVLSHAHYDHADGMETFFQKNDHAKFFVRETTHANCYAKYWFVKKYIGIPKQIEEKYPNRIEYAKGDTKLCEGVYLIPHKTPGLEKIGRKMHFYRREGNKWVADDFSHEQSLVIETKQGLVIFNSCSHGGVDNIITEVAQTFPGKKIVAMVGGFHLFGTPEKEVRALAERLRQIGIENIYTGHCTGKKAYEILKEELGERVSQIKVGFDIEY